MHSVVLSSVGWEPALSDSHESPPLSFQGISQAARYVYRRLVSDGILSQAFSVAPVRLSLFFIFHCFCYQLFGFSTFPHTPSVPQEYRLVVVGHSLGAGAAALLAFMLRSSYPHVRCYAFSPPRGLLRYCAHEWDRRYGRVRVTVKAGFLLVT